MIEPFFKLAAAAVGISLVSLAAASAETSVFRAELRPGWQMQSGNQMAAVHLSLNDGWKTYWRSPGDNGIPPQFDWSGSENVKSVQFHWPRPHVYDVSGFKTIGYKHDLVLPVEVTPKDPSRAMRLKASVDLGVCSDICIPASFSFEAALPRPGASDDTIRRALGQRASTAKEAGLTQIACTLSATDDGLRISAQIEIPSTGGSETVVFEPGQPGVWVSEADVTRQGKRLTATAVLVGQNGTALALERGQVVVTILGEHRAVEINGCPAG